MFVRMLYRLFGPVVLFLAISIHSQDYQQQAQFAYTSPPQYGNYINNQPPPQPVQNIQYTTYPQYQNPPPPQSYGPQPAPQSYGPQPAPQQQQQQTFVQQPPTYQQTHHNPHYQQPSGSQAAQFGARYHQPSGQHHGHPVAHGVVQSQPRAQPLPTAILNTNAPASGNTELAPLATAPPSSFPSSIPNYASQPQGVPLAPQQTGPAPQQPTGQFFYPPPAGGYYQQQQQPPSQQTFQQGTQYPGGYYNPYANNTSSSAYREPPVTHFNFKEGTAPTYCSYGVWPVPEYNTPRKKCVPWHPFCGIVFTCIMDV